MLKIAHKLLLSNIYGYFGASQLAFQRSAYFDMMIIDRRTEIPRLYVSEYEQNDFSLKFSVWLRNTVVPLFRITTLVRMKMVLFNCSDFI